MKIISSISCFMMLLIPVTIGIVLHFVIPLFIVTNSSQQILTVYKSSKIDLRSTQQLTLLALTGKSISSLFSKFLTFVSMSHNLLSKISQIQQTNTNFVNILNINDKKGCQINPFQSAWSIDNITSLNQMKAQQIKYYQAYQRIQSFLRSYKLSGSLLSLQIIVYSEKFSIIFKFPCNSISNSQLIYNNTIKTWKINNKKIHQVFTSLNLTYSCSINEINNQQIDVICLKIENEELRSIVEPRIRTKFAKNTYYLFAPIENQSQSPKIILSLSDQNNSQIIVSNPQPLDLPNQIPKQIFLTQTKTSIFTYQITPTITYHIIPIYINHFSSQLKIKILYLLLRTQNSLHQILVPNGKTQILTKTLPPIIIAFILSSIISIFIIRYVTKDLQQTIQILDKHCNLLNKGQIDLNIPDYQQTQDLRNLFKILATINKLHQISSQIYYSGPAPQKLLKYIIIQQLFIQLSYDTTNLTEIMGNCYFNMKQFGEAAIYYTTSINKTLNQINKNYGRLTKIIKIKKSKQKSDKQLLDQNYRILQKCLRLKLVKKYICLIWSVNIYQRNIDMEQTMKNYYITAYPDTNNTQYIMMKLMEVRYNFCQGKTAIAIKGLKKSEKLIKYCQKQQSDNQMWLPYQALRSYYFYVNALFYNSQQNIPLTFKNYMKCLQSDIFCVQLHRRVRGLVKSLLEKQKLLNTSILKTHYMPQVNEGQPRQFLFLFDWTRNSSINKQQQRLQEKIIIEKAINMFQTILIDTDRLSISKFDQDAQVICTLMMKQKNEQLLKRQLKNLRNFKSSKFVPDLCQALTITLNRIRRLQMKKVIVMFMKKHAKINGDQIEQILQNVTDVTLIILQVKNPGYKSPYFYNLNLNDELSLKRILMQRKEMCYNNSISVF